MSSASCQSRAIARAARVFSTGLVIALAAGSVSAAEPPAAALAADTAPDTRQTRVSDTSLATAVRLRDRALTDDTAWNVLEGLTTEVGPRLAGSDADARAVAWAVARFKALGFDRVWTEPVSFPKWQRRSESAAVLGAHAQALKVTALGGSPGGTIEGEVLRFADFAALQAATPEQLRGRIAFVDYQMHAFRDGRDYGPGSTVRTRGPALAASKGAIGFVMRSAATDDKRDPHTGITRFDADGAQIPAAALSVPDAEQLARLLARGPVRIRLALDCGWDGTATSYNVIGEVRGRRWPEQYVLIGGHLDSWDLGTGAIDDGAGVAITAAAARLIAGERRRPARSVRVIAFANEEQGLYGGKAYADAHASAVANVQLMAESDFGADRIYGFNLALPKDGAPVLAQLASVLKPLGIAYMPGSGGPGPDIGPFAAKGAAWAALRQDGTRYFDLHHSADDTLDKVDPAQLRQNVAAYAALAWIAADADGSFGSWAHAVQPPGE